MGKGSGNSRASTQVLLGKVHHDYLANQEEIKITLQNGSHLKILKTDMGMGVTETELGNVACKMKVNKIMLHNFTQTSCHVTHNYALELHLCIGTWLCAS